MDFIPSVQQSPNQAQTSRNPSAVADQAAAPPSNPSTFQQKMNAAGVSGSSFYGGVPGAGPSPAPSPVHPPQQGDVRGQQGDVRGKSFVPPPSNPLGGASNPNGNQIPGAAMAAFNALVDGFGAVFDVGFNAGKNTRNIATGKPTESLQQTTQEEQNTDLFGVSAATAKGVAAGTAAYIIPGGAILHGIGDTQESLGARVFDVAVGSLFLVPAAGEAAGIEAGGTLAKVGGAAASLPGRASIGAGISAAGTALQGGSPTQILEAGAAGAALGAAAPYAIKGISAAGEAVGKAAHPLLYSDTEIVGGSFAGSVQDIGLTEPRGSVVNEAGEIQGRAGQIGEGGRSYGTPRGTGTGNISTGELGRNIPTETGTSVSPTEEGNIGGRSGGVQRSLINQNVEHFNEGLTASNTADYLAGRSALDVAGRVAGETKTVSTLRGPLQSVKDFFSEGTPKGGEVAIGSDYGTAPKVSGTGESSEDLFKSLGQSNEPYHSGERFFNQHGPSGPGGGGNLELDTGSSYESAGARTAYGDTKYVQSSRESFGGDESGTTFIPVPPGSAFSQRSKQMPGQGTDRQQKQNQGPSPTTTTGNPPPFPWRFKFPGPQTTTPTTLVTPGPGPGPSKTIVTPAVIQTPVATPGTNTTPKQTQGFVVEQGFSPFIDVPQAQELSSRTKQGAFPFPMSPFTMPSGGNKKSDAFGFRKIKHPVGLIGELPSGFKTKKRRK